MHFSFKIEKNRDFDAIGFGTNAVDFLITVPKYPEYNSKTELTDYTKLAGGEIASTMTGLSRLGLRTSYIGRLGDDDVGEFGLKSLKDEGVDTTFTEMVKGAKTQLGFIIIDARTGERTVIWQRDELLKYSADEVSPDMAARASAIHMTPHDARACISLAQSARSAKTIVSLDIDNIFDGTEELLPLVDILIASADLPKRLTGIDDIKASLMEMQTRFGSSVIGTTLGEEGSLILVNGEFITTPGFPVPGGCKDTTGAGDAFRTGLLYGILTGETVEQSARIANAVASLKCRAVGARTSLPTVDELKDMVGM